jgi:Helix-turn-helix domain
MLTREEDVEIHALLQRGWSISAIARHTGRNRRTIRNYLTGVTVPGVRKPVGEDSFAPFVEYVSARLREDPHLWARTLCDELEGLGFVLSYPSLTRNIRVRGLRPVCQACRSVTERPNAIIAHEPGDETQWDWLDLPDLILMARRTGLIGVRTPKACSARRPAMWACSRCCRARKPAPRPAAPRRGVLDDHSRRTYLWRDARCFRR